MGKPQVQAIMADIATMNNDLRVAFGRIKPICDVLMVCPTLEILVAYTTRVGTLKDEAIQELQQYLLFPLITRIKCAEVRKKEDVHLKMLDTIRMVVEKITINSFEMYMKLETGLLCIIFDHKNAGMISDTTEEVKYATLKCLSTVMMHIPHDIREKALRTQVPMLAQTVFVSVHIAKLEKMRVLRLAAIDCVLAHTMTHPSVTENYHMTDPKLELLAIDNMLSSILPGVLAALQDVATCVNNPGHMVIVAALDAIHRIICLPMHDKYLPKTTPLRTEDFVRIVREKKRNNTEVSNKEQKSVKDMKKRSMEWFEMAGEKLTLITKSLCALRMHDHYKVRMELAVFCYRVLSECSMTMPASAPICLDVLISLTKDEYPEVGEYSTAVVNAYFASPAAETHSAVENLQENFLAVLSTMPRVLSAIDNVHKLSALNLLHGYIAVLADARRPQRLTGTLSAAPVMQQLCAALCDAARHSARLALLTRHAVRDVSVPPPLSSPWSVFLHLDSVEAVQRLQQTCQLLGGAECSELVLDSLLDQFHERAAAEPACVINWMASAPDCSFSMAKRVLNTYIQEDVWYSPLEVDSGEGPLNDDDTLDVSVYNPRAWDRDSVPDLYEGTVETRYTDISYARPRVGVARSAHTVPTVGEAQRNLALCCLLTEGVGIVAQRLGEAYQPYLLRTLCLVLERVGSEYELLHLAGLKAINQIAGACGHGTVGELIKCNADYFTHQITASLKKSWNCHSALQILSVVMEYSDVTILDCLYGIVEHVLVQSCDKYYEQNLVSYLQVFLTVVQCIRKWFPSPDPSPTDDPPLELDLLQEVDEYVRVTREAERLLSDSDIDSGKSLDEMYNEDMKNKEENGLDYNDKVTEEKPPIPQHVVVTITILKRAVHFITSARRDAALLAMQTLSVGLPVLVTMDDQLLPLVHSTWAPLVARFHCSEPVVLRRAFDLLVTLAALSKDFIRSRTVKEVLPEVYKFLHKSAKDSHLKDTGSYYRSSQAYTLQMTALTALPSLARDLGLEDDCLTEAMACVDPYLSKKQPKPLQTLAVTFFKRILDYDYTAAWYHLRQLCNNDVLLNPPDLQYLRLEPIVGAPSQPRDKDYQANIQLIYDYMVT